MSFSPAGGATHRDFNCRIPGRSSVQFGSAAFFSPTIGPGGLLTLSGGNRVATYDAVATGAWRCARILDRTGAKVYSITDKRYYEIFIGPPADPADYIGIDIGVIDNAAVQTVTNPNGNAVWGGASSTAQSAGVFTNGALSANAPFGAASGVVYGCAIDGPSSKMYISVNGVYVAGQNPVTGISGILGFPQTSCGFITTHDNGTGTQHPVYTFSGGGSSGALAFAPPAGFKAWNQKP